MTSITAKKTKANTKDNGNALTAMAVATNTTNTAHLKANPSSIATPKPSFNPWKTVNTARTTTSVLPINTTPLPKDLPLQTHCCLRWWHTGNKNTSKNTYRNFMTEFLMHAATIDTTLTVFKFFSKDSNPSRIPTPPLRTPFQLPMGQGNL